jgi:ornithine carbamoyltransferase
MRKKNIMNISDFKRNDFLEIIDIHVKDQLLFNKTIGLIFEKHSTRTRLSFMVGISKLGGNSIDIKFQELNISRDESFEDTFKAMNCYLDGLVYRTSDHQRLIHASQFFHQPIINALSDQSHPCQIVSDLFTLKERFGTLKCNILWIGDMNNVCFSLVEAANLLEEINLTIFTPSLISKQKKWLLGSNILITDKLKDINLDSINCVMTDVFISMNDEDSEEKISLLKPYCVTSELMAKTAPDSIFMHCLPAKVGLEVSEEVFRSSKSIVWRQAYNRMVAQQKLLQFIYQ